MVDIKENPSPQEVEAAVSRFDSYRRRTTVEIRLGTHWRAVRVTDLKSLPNSVKPMLTILFFRPKLLVATPTRRTLDAWIALTAEGANNNKCTLMQNVGMEDPREALRRGITVSFRYANDEAQSFMQQQFAKAMGKRYRHKKLLRDDKYEYTEEP